MIIHKNALISNYTASYTTLNTQHDGLHSSVYGKRN